MDGGNLMALPGVFPQLMGVFLKPAWAVLPFDCYSCGGEQCNRRERN